MSTLTLLKWKDSHGREQKFRLINRVSGRWLDFGYRLQRNTSQLEGWERECLLNSDRCWCKVMSHWLKEDGTPDYPTTWKGVFCLLEDVDCLQVAQDLQKALSSVIPPPPPPLPASTGDNETSDTTPPPPTADSTGPLPTADSAELITTATPPTMPSQPGDHNSTMHFQYGDGEVTEPSCDGESYMPPQYGDGEVILPPQSDNSESNTLNSTPSQSCGSDSPTTHKSSNGGSATPTQLGESKSTAPLQPQHKWERTSVTTSPHWPPASNSEVTTSHYSVFTEEEDTCALFYPSLADSSWDEY